MTTTETEPDDTGHDDRVLWEQTRYDSGLYRCRVEREGTGGKLSVTLVGNIDHVLHEETVKVDRLDEDKWRQLCATVISNPSLRSREGARG